MRKFYLGFILIVLLGTFDNSIGYEWVSLSSSDLLPINSTNIWWSKDRFIGKAHYDDETLPAQITENPIKCFIPSKNKTVSKDECEILVNAARHCELSHFKFTQMTERILRVGTTSNGAPISLGMARSKTSRDYEIIGLVLAEKEPLSWFEADPKTEQYYYYCYPQIAVTTTEATFISKTGLQISKPNSGCDLKIERYIYMLAGVLSVLLTFRW